MNVPTEWSALFLTGSPASPQAGGHESSGLAVKIGRVRGLLSYRRFVILAAFALGSVPGALADVPRLRGPAVGDRLEPESLVEISWSLDRFPSGDDEWELVLSLDGGRSFPVRVTANLDPATRRVLWRVPALPTDQARLAVRTGSDGEPSEEVPRLIGPSFVIAASVRAPVEELFAVRSEWRTREALTGNSARDSATDLRGAAPDGIYAGSVSEAAALSRSSSAALPGPLPAAAAVACRAASPRLEKLPILPRPCPNPLRE
jgi:hypothetical protein